MSEENVGQQFKTLYRGISTQSPSLNKVDFENLGAHWTPDRSVAESFALSRAGDTYFDRDPKVLRGIVVSAQVPHEHIIDPNSEEGEHWRETMDVFDRDSHEEEHTVRPGSPLTLGGVHRVSLRDGEDVETHEAKRYPKQGRA